MDARAPAVAAAVVGFFAAAAVPALPLVVVAVGVVLDRAPAGPGLLAAITGLLALTTGLLALTTGLGLLLPGDGLVPGLGLLPPGTGFASAVTGSERARLAGLADGTRTWLADRGDCPGLLCVSAEKVRDGWGMGDGRETQGQQTSDKRRKRRGTAVLKRD